MHTPTLASKYFYRRIKDLTCQNISKILYFQVNLSMRNVSTCSSISFQQSALQPRAHCGGSTFPPPPFAKMDCFTVPVSSSLHILWRIYYAQFPIPNSKMSSDVSKSRAIHIGQKISKTSFLRCISPY